MVELNAGHRNREEKLFFLERALETKRKHDRTFVPCCARYAAVQKAMLQEGFKHNPFRYKREVECRPIELLESHTGDELAKIRSRRLAGASGRSVGGVHARIIEGLEFPPEAEKLRW